MSRPFSRVCVKHSFGDHTECGPVDKAVSPKVAEGGYLRPGARGIQATFTPINDRAENSMPLGCGVHNWLI
jgi:hypothetical protein